VFQLFRRKPAQVAQQPADPAPADRRSPRYLMYAPQHRADGSTVDPPPAIPEIPEERKEDKRGVISGDMLSKLLQCSDPRELEGTELEIRDNLISNTRPLIVEGWLDLSHASIARSIFLWQCEFRAETHAGNAAIIIESARLSEFTLSRCKFDYVFGQDVQVDGNLGMARCDARMVYLPGARVDGGVNFYNLKLKRPEGSDEDCYLSLHGAHISGELYLVGAQIDGELDFSNAVIDRVVRLDRLDVHHRGHQAINGLRSKIGANLFMSWAKIEGHINLRGVTVGGTVECTGTKIDAAALGDDRALAFDNAHFAASVFLNDGFGARGTTSLEHAHIKGSLVCVGGSFARNADNRVALDLSDARIDNVLVLSGVNGMDGDLELDGAHADSFADDGSAWPKPGVISLDGFTFERFRDAPTPANTTPLTWEERCKWLKLQSASHLGREKGGGELKLQPWTQTAKVLRAMGHNDDAAHILEEREDLRFRYQRITTRAGWFGWLVIRLPLKVFAGHGFQPFRALAALWVLWLLSTAVFAAAFHRGMFIPSPDKLMEAARYKVETAEPPQSYQVFDPIFYSADVILPFLDLHQETYWIPVANADRPTKAHLPRPLDARAVMQTMACPHLWPCKNVEAATASSSPGQTSLIEWLLDQGLARIWYYFAAFSGLFLITISATGFAGLFDRQ
jgi:hypothetical protein